MKRYAKFLTVVLFVMILCSAASAAVPSLTMLSTKTCPACEQMEKVLNELNASRKGKLTTSHIYLEDNPDIARKYNVRYVPTLLFRDASGKVVAQEIGYRSAAEVVKIFENAGIKL